jgi:sugar phosphate isomerase/epimerase
VTARSQDGELPGRPLSLAHLSALQLTPAELVRGAAAAGFDMVGALRLTPTSDGSGHAVLTDPRLRRETELALADTGLPVLDVEVFRLRPDSRARDAEPLVEAGAALGARFVLCTVEDPEPVRRAQGFAAVCALASSYGLTCMLEPMVFSAVRTPAEADDLLQLGGRPPAGILVDALHLFRAGGTVADVAALDPGLLPYAQLCDAAGTGPAPSREAAIREAVGHRLAPGEGRLPLDDLLGAVPPGAPVSVEAPHPSALDDPHRWIRHLAVATRRVLGPDRPVAALSEEPA